MTREGIQVDMTILANGLEKTEMLDGFAYSMKGEPDPARPVSSVLDITALPMREPDFEIIAGDEHPEAPSFMRDFADCVRTMAPPCQLPGGPRIILENEYGPYVSPSRMRIAKGRRPGSRFTFNIPHILVSTELTPRRPSQSALRRQVDPTVDEYGRKITQLFGEEEVFRQIAVWIIHEADRIWPGDEETGSWSVRVWESLRADQDPSRLNPDLQPVEEILDAFVEFAVTYMRHSHLKRFPFMEDVMFHTVEFARICSGELGREIMEHGDQLWTGKGPEG